ncbi:hypothetical protein HPP92_013916 [Vanilla planifolia]|uniref:Uncharacterized protein n=1 Tax=Vanilla planifolia TaxID=51239 RepID=A0A835QVN3_VANPL|nr:hypothetical protein HPP92_013916 [Vanilla planifolia]
MASISSILLPALLLLLSTGEGQAARHLLDTPTAAPSVPTLPSPTLPTLPPLPTMPAVPKVVLPPIPTIPGIPKIAALPPLPAIPVMPTIPKVVLPPLPSFVPNIPFVPKFPAIPSVPVVAPTPSASSPLRIDQVGVLDGYADECNHLIKSNKDDIRHCARIRLWSCFLIELF